MSILSDYLAGMRVRNIQHKYHITNIYDYIPKDLRRNSVPYREEIKNEYLNGATIEELTKKYRKSRASIRYILKGYNIKLRKVRKVEWPHY